MSDLKVRPPRNLAKARKVMSILDGVIRRKSEARIRDESDAGWEALDCGAAVPPNGDKRPKRKGELR